MAEYEVARSKTNNGPLHPIHKNRIAIHNNLSDSTTYMAVPSATIVAEPATHDNEKLNCTITAKTSRLLTIAQTRRIATSKEQQKAKISGSRKAFRANLVIKTGRPSSWPSFLFPPGTVKRAAKVIVANSPATTDNVLATDFKSAMSHTPCFILSTHAKRPLVAPYFFSILWMNNCMPCKTIIYQ
ncbi:hypothetical protein AAC387_Pa10g0866 [Persea americana]